MWLKGDGPKGMETLTRPGRRLAPIRGTGTGETRPNGGHGATG